MDLTILDFVVVNTKTGTACAAFRIPQDAIEYIHARRVPFHYIHARRVPYHYDLVNADGSMLSPQLRAAVDAARGKT